LTSEPGIVTGDLGINDSGEVVYVRSAGNGYEIVSTTRGVIGTGRQPAINAAGEVVWTLDGRIRSSVRGDLSAGDSPRINATGDVLWTGPGGVFFLRGGVLRIVNPNAAGYAIPGQQSINDRGTIALAGPSGIFIASCGGGDPFDAAVAPEREVDVPPPPFANCVDAGVTNDPPEASTSELVTTAVGPSDLLVDTSSVYFIDQSGATIDRVDKAGGTAMPLATAQTAKRIASDDAYVYWSASSEIVRVQKNGAGLPEHVIYANAGAIAVDEAYVYWGEDAQCGPGGIYAPCVYKAPKDGSGAMPVVMNAGYAPAGNLPNPPANVRVDSRFVYWMGDDVSASVTNVLEIDKLSGSTLALGSNGRASITMDETTVYILYGIVYTIGSRSIAAIDKATHQSRILFTVARFGDGYGELVADGNYLYWNGSNGAGVQRLLKCVEKQSAGTTISSLALTHLAVDDRYVYGVLGSEIRRIPK
jgi:hypothetical protein